MENKLTESTRLDLIPKGSTVLVKSKHMKRLQPFTIKEWYPGDREVEGILVLTNQIVKLDGNLPTYKMDDEWIEMTMSRVNSKIDLLNDVYGVLESFKSPKKVSATLTN